MEIEVRFLENLRLEARFDDFKVMTDQPIRYKGDGSAPSPFDYFLASSALCAAYFARVYCLARGIPTDDIHIVQNNIIDPENRYKQIIQIQVDLPADLSAKDREGILRSVERCTVKKVIQQGPEFKVVSTSSLASSSGLLIDSQGQSGSETRLVGKDLPLEVTISNMTGILTSLGYKLEIASWRNLVSNVWSVHIRDIASPVCFTNGKGASKESALCSALGEYIERLSSNYFYNDYYLGQDISTCNFVHYPNERWFPVNSDDQLPAGLMDENFLKNYSLDGELKASNLVDSNSGITDRGICALPFIRQSDQKTIYVPVSILGNLYVSNGMSAGNTVEEAQVQCLSEIFERAVKKQIIEKEYSLPDVPRNILEKYPKILAGIEELEAKGFPVLVKDASLGGRFPVLCVTLMNPKTGGVFPSFGAHPRFEVALERSLTELLQGRSFEGLNDIPLPTFRSLAVTEPNNFVEHFIDSTGVISWKFFSAKSDFDFVAWDFTGSTSEECSYLFAILKELKKEVYVTIYDHFGAKACRIIVPGYSEIYPSEDLIWNNTNQALLFRPDILNLHNLKKKELGQLIERFEESQLDHYMKISDLIGIEFDENTEWGQLTVGELKLLIFLFLKRYEEAQDLVSDLLTFSESSPQRKLFYLALDAVLGVTLSEDLEISDYLLNFSRMYGEELIAHVVGSVEGTTKFYGLTKTNLQLEGLDKHLRIIESYKKIHKARGGENFRNMSEL